MLNPWLLLGAATAVLAACGSGIVVGKKLERTAWLEREAAYQQQVQAETDRANEVAQAYGLALNQSNDKAAQLRRKIHEQRDQLASCTSAGGVRLTPDFVGLYDAALQTNPANPGEPAGETGGADPVELLAVQVENGQRWKSCRDQLNALIDILGTK
jgi:hypothetical protein